MLFASRIRSRRTNSRNTEPELLEQRCLLTTVGLDSLNVSPHEYAQDTVIVRFEGDNTRDIPLPGVKLGRSLGSSGIYEVNLSDDVQPESAIESLSQLPFVEYAHPDFTVQALRTPNDPSFNSLWGMHNTGQNGGTFDADIDAVEAWDERTSASNVVVAVIDTGVDYTHPDLVDNMWRNPGEIANDGIDNDGNGFVDDYFGYDFYSNDSNPYDTDGHGTHVAGTIGATGNNGIGVTGVAWDVQIMALRFLGPGGTGSLSDAVRAINYARLMGADIANNSWGGGGFNQTLDLAIAQYSHEGGIFVAAAGNENNHNDLNPTYPANYHSVYSVAATTRNDEKASFSNFGPASVDIAAPGDTILSTLPGGGYGYLSGTSMAAPMVSGAMALLRAKYPTYTRLQLAERIWTTADPLATRWTAGGRLNLAKALSDDGATAGPRIIEANWSQDVSFVNLVFDRDVNPSSVSTSDASATGPNGAVAIQSVSPVGSTGREFRVSFSSPQTAPGQYSLRVGPGITDLDGNLMDQDRDGNPGEASDDRFVSTYDISSDPDATEYSWSGRYKLKDARANKKGVVKLGKSKRKIRVRDKINVSDINVRIDVDHTYVSDMIIDIISPRKTRVRLFNRRGADGDAVLARFDDEAGTAIADGAAPFNGSFRPDNPLSAFDGESAKGAWTIFIRDVATLDSGYINGVTLEIAAEDQQFAFDAPEELPSGQQLPRKVETTDEGDLFPESAPPTQSRTLEDLDRNEVIEDTVPTESKVPSNLAIDRAFHGIADVEPAESTLEMAWLASDLLTLI